jgi:alpha-ketoglutarate-dependent taurine dioxygenase
MYFLSLIVTTQSLLTFFLEGLTVMHTGDYHRKLAAAKGTTIRRPFVDHEHPLVRTHPLTGMKSLYLSPIFASHIVGLSKHESDAILTMLNNHVVGGHDFQVRYHWNEDDVAVW